MAKKRSWALIIISVGAFVVIVGGGAIAIVGYLVAQQFSFQQEPGATVESSARQMAETRARFKGQSPFIEIGADGAAPVVHRELQGPTRHSLSAMVVVGWDGRSRQGVFRLKAPFWVVSMGSRRHLRVSRPDGGTIDLQVTIEDLERRGPGLILDRTDERGRQIIVWTE
jgi:hypothetical protein